MYPTSRHGGDALKSMGRKTEKFQVCCLVAALLLAGPAVAGYAWWLVYQLVCNQLARTALPGLWPVAAVGVALAILATVFAKEAVAAAIDLLRNL